MMSVVGFINVNKPTGLTSRTAVDRVADAAGASKSGHAGTLDPLATGVLVVALGWTTRLIEYVQGRPKRYRATFRLGQSSPSDDRETEITRHDNLPQPSLAELQAALPTFTGPIMQRPPAFSAMKIAGKRAYKLARKGRTVELEPRPVMIYRLSVERYEFPELVLDIECGQGTYIRSLGRDLAEQLGTHAIMTELERTAIGSFTVADACPWSAITSGDIAPWLLPPQRAIADMPTFQINDDERGEIALGRPIAARAQCAAEREYAALDAAGALVGILVPDAELGLRVVRNFVAPNSGY